MVVDQPLRESLLAQARLRLRLGMPALLFIVGAVYFFDAAYQRFGPLAMGLLSLTYVLYCVMAYVVAARNNDRHDKALLGITIVGDPLMLSVFLYGAGNGAIVFVGFYLFTILGFGFRVGIASMRACQAIAIAGFSLVAFFSPIWHEMQMVAASHLVLLVVVPLYASALIRGLRNAQLTAQYESEAKSRLLANVSHELRTPLTGIISAAQLIETATSDSEMINVKARSIADMAWHLDGEISQLLDLSKLQIGTSTHEIVSFTLDSLISNVIDAVQASATAKGLSLLVKIDPTINVPVKGQVQSIRSVLINLVGNAVKFTESGCVDISISAVETDEQRYVVRFRVADTGIGIPLEHVGRIFEPFYQVERGTNRKYGGTGLGMAISKEHIERLGGKIELESTFGQGSVFWFDISLEKVHIESSKSVDNGGIEVVQKKRVLLADDNATNLALIREMLCRDGHEVIAAISGTEALSHLASDSFDIIMLDYNMNDIDGARVWGIYAMSNTKPAPTFFITADTTVATRERLLGLGASGVIYKPITFSAIRKTLQSVFPADVIPMSATPRTKSATQSAGRLMAIAIEYLAPDLLDNLSEINPSRNFAKKMLTDAKKDMTKIADEMTTAISESNVTAIRRHGHALKGVSLNIGALRLAAFGEKMMSSSFEAVQGMRLGLEDSLKEEVAGTISAIDDLLINLDIDNDEFAGVGVKNGRS
jgi:two-component system, sensor histidine kinase RpfC